MKLATLVQNANDTYDLGLGDSGVEAFCSRLRRAGIPTEVSASDASRTVDMILSYADANAGSAHEVYASLKAVPVVEAGSDGCPKCSARMREVLLVGDRKAAYCGACAVTLPIKSDPRHD